jgi:aminoglycoside phosphotransferase (APT) family kinase protein
VVREHYTHGWLPVVLPAAARRFRIVDATLADVLAEAGANIVSDASDVEIVPSSGELHGDAPLGIVTVEPISSRALRESPLRAGARVSRSLRVRARAATTRRAALRLGYIEASVLCWDVAHRVRLPGLPRSPVSLAERLPTRALVVARRGPPLPTVLEEAIRGAAAASGCRLDPQWVSIRAGTVVVAAEAGALRVAVGRGRFQIDSQAAALQALRRAELPADVADRIPWLLADSRDGLGRWSLERFLPGTRPRSELTPALWHACVEFLAALHAAPGGGEGGSSLAELAEVVAPVCRPGTATVLRTLTEALERELAELPRGMGHGDFFAGNLLADGDRLSGVLDWDAGGPGRLPLVDLLHLELTRSPYGSDTDWGRAVLERLLPLAHAGGSPDVQRLASAAGFGAEPRLLEALVFAYWLQYAAYQIRTHLDRRSEPAWIEGNVERVVHELARLDRRSQARTH